MADTNFNALTFTAAPCYTFKADVSPNEACDQLTARVGHLVAQLNLIVGEGFKHFENYEDETKHAYLWSCLMAAEEIRDLTAKL